MSEITRNTQKILQSIPRFNPFGEPVTLVAAVKLQTPEAINEAIAAGITDIGDNHVQEFRQKYDKITGGARRHFIGHLQTNKVKYLVGNIDLYHSVDRYALAEELSRRGDAKGVTSEILLQVNIGNEATKGGFGYDEATEAYLKIKKLPALKITGLMAMLPDTDDKAALCGLAKKMRALFDRLKSEDMNIRHLSMGMSGDYELCIENGSNMIRLGTAIFGQRNYN